MGSFLDRFKHNDKLPIRIASPAFGQPSAEMISEYGLTRRTAFLPHIPSHHFYLVYLFPRNIA